MEKYLPDVLPFHKYIHLKCQQSILTTDLITEAWCVQCSMNFVGPSASHRTTWAVGSCIDHALFILLNKYLNVDKSTKEEDQLRSKELHSIV